jgi:hypothetical protein
MGNLTSQIAPSGLPWLEGSATCQHTDRPCLVGSRQGAGRQGEAEEAFVQ